MIVCLVPYLSQYGGIQTFAKTTKRFLKGKFDIQLFDWWLPQSFTGLLLKTRIPWKKNRIIKRAGLVHFWDPLTAIGFEKTDFIVSCHGKEILPANLKSFEKKALKKVFNKAKAIHVNSKFTQRLLLKTFPFIPKEKIELIYPGVDFSKKRKKEVKKKKKLIIGTLSRFNPRKNILNIIDALDIIKEKHKLVFKYLLIGKGMEQEKIVARLKKARFEWCYWKDISEKEKLTKFYSQIDIFVLPTQSLTDDVEGFGIVYLEANSFGIPVIASRVDGVKEAVKENVSGIFTDPKDPDKIAQSIYQLSTTSKKYQQSAKRWAQNFSFKKTALKLEKLYEKFYSNK